MKRKLFIATVLILSGLLVVANKSYAWEPPSCYTPGTPVLYSPANGATSQSTSDVLLSWSSVTYGDVYYIYINTFNPPTYQRGSTVAGITSWHTSDWSTLQPNTKYYWRIVAQHVCSGTSASSSSVVWHFTTGCAAPGKATGPNPANEATSVSVTTDLGWTAGAGATSHDVYFGTVSPGTFQGNQTGTTTFDTGTMSNNTTYYWRIDEKNAGGTTTGDVWSFITVQAGEIIEINSDITTNQLWTANNIYYITDWVNVQALLVIEPGTVIYFSYDGSLFVNNGGTLISCGTPDNPIIYTSDTGYGWGDYYCAISIQETASPATKIAYNYIDCAYIAIISDNITLDHPIENNYLFYNSYGVLEYGTRHTDIINNLIFYGFNYYYYSSGIEVFMESYGYVADANSHILIQNNTCDYHDYGIMVHGVVDGNNAGSVMLVNNIITESYECGLNLVDHMMFFVSNTGYGGNYMNKNREFEEYNPVETTQNPYRHIEGGDYFDIRYLDPNCVFINAGLGYIEETPLIGMTTDINGTPDSNFVDLGFHHPNWNYSNVEQNEPNIIPTISGDPNTGWVNVGITGFAPDTQRVFVLADGQYVREIFGFQNGDTLGMDISEYGGGERQLKAVSVNSDSHITCSNITNVAFSCPLNYCLLPSNYEPNKPLYFAAFNPSAGNVSVKVYADCGNLVWSQSYSGDSIFGSIPAEITRQYEFDYVSFGEASIRKIIDPVEPELPGSVKALIVLPDLLIRLSDFRSVWAVQTAFKNNGIKYKKLKGRTANYDTIAFYAATNPVKYIYIDAHGGYGRDPITGNYYFAEGVLRTHVDLYDGPIVSMKQSDFAPGGAPSWCESLGRYWEKKAKSFIMMGFTTLEFAYFDACYSGRLKINSHDQLVEGQPGQLGVVYDGPYSDMSVALGMYDPSESRFYQGWYDEATFKLWPFRSDYQKWTQDEWEALGDGDNLEMAIMYAISQQTEFEDPNAPVNAYRLKGQGFIWELFLRD